jgi:hypothetical protein
MRGVRHWLLAASLCVAPAMAAVTDTDLEGLCAYVAGCFHEAAVGLKQSIRERSQSGGETQAGESVPRCPPSGPEAARQAEHETSGIRREVASPVIKGWMEEEMPLK